MHKTTNRYTPEVRERAFRMVLNGEGQHVIPLRSEAVNLFRSHQVFDGL